MGSQGGGKESRRNGTGERKGPGEVIAAAEQGIGSRKRVASGSAKERKKARQHIHIQQEQERDTTTPELSQGLNKETSSAETSTAQCSETPLRPISVVEFAEARAFEISALQKALENSTENAGVQRVFQTVPRYMRRRAASHNVKRLPQRLREKALAQIAKDPGGPQKKKGKPPTRPKRRRTKSATQDFARRQMGKRWLETHVWHAKRMKMVELWGCKLAEHPNDKSSRASFRAAKNQCLVHDASYFQVIEISGPEQLLQILLRDITDPTIPSIGSARYIEGSRQGMTYLYGYLQYPKSAIAPATFLWRPRNGRNDEGRRLWLWLHPAVYEHVHDLLLQVAKECQIIEQVTICSLYDELVRFELTGPRTHAVLHHIMKVSEDSVSTDGTTTNMAARQLWAKLALLRSSASLPPGVAIGLTIHDPRLSFPPKMPPRNGRISPEVEADINTCLMAWPEGVADSSIWDPAIRKASLIGKATESDLNARRAQALIPGTALQPLPHDVHVPILLLQRNYLIQEAGSKVQKEVRELVAGWDLVLPKGWAMDVWKSLVFAGVRVAGLRDRHSFHFEAGLPCFPYDFPETAAYEAWADRVRHEEEEAWKRTPQGKKPNYKAHGVKSPFEPPFWDLVGLEPASPQAIDDEVVPVGVCTEVDGVTNSKGEEKQSNDMMDVEEPNSGRDQHSRDSSTASETNKACAQRFSGICSRPYGRYHVINSPRLISYLRTALSSASVEALPQLLMEEVVRLIRHRYEIPNKLVNLTLDTMEHMLVRVRITMLRRGTPGERGIIYSATEKEYEFWKHAVEKNSDDCSVNEEQKLLDVIPPPSAIVGYITTGRFSFAQGHGQALGCCKLSGLHRIVQECESAGREHTHFVLVRGITGRLCLPAIFNLIS
ncbi:ribonuclease P/MRP protein subunit POP1 [Spizellomyces punctatus DAOM BR117]|uniref:Uncharacterized protein n=1 Tax=Spizellomyces punctatus (strain DAOM BR117) TaxID=645134 RepID=A0A0L0HVD8_SPIPD|nr:ribonuclease P/MRP protein subunit POP1 [Spizellomyces punctatus DAOM BR117]KND05052.1 hypothetical protein SPPG_00728 [Spizellomyces punctatus DAOM BR117]|eukprot:XP_016613091.1 hypothetical protein SPPG_00728 [Spizellomyces punctatus DAOM BR117]